MRNWCFTKYDLAMPDLDPTLVRYCVYQREVCPDTGREHLQGYIELKKSTRMNAVKVLLEDATVHLEPRRGSREQARDYCMKVDSRVEGTDPIEFGEFVTSQGTRNDCARIREMVKEGKTFDDIWEEVPGAMRMKRTIDCLIQKEAIDKEAKEMKEMVGNLILRDWQNQVVVELEAQDRRKILWVCDKEGGRGKSILAEYLAAEKGAFVVTGGRSEDIAHAYDVKQKMVVFDLARESQFMPYGLIENFKNGRLFSQKYDSATKISCGVKVVVLANVMPDLNKLSRDRWSVATFDRHGNLNFEYESVTPTPEISFGFNFPRLSPRHRVENNRRESMESVAGGESSEDGTQRVGDFSL